MLKSLTDEHRQLLSKLIGELSIAKVPDLAAVADELDRALTADEKIAIDSAGAELDQNAKDAVNDLVREMMVSGQNVRIGHGEFPRLTLDQPGMTVLALSIEELLTNLNLTRDRKYD